MIRKFLAGLAVMAGLSPVFSPVAALAQDDVERQIDALLAEMTLEEKIGQLTQYSSFWDATGPAPQGGEQEEKFDQVRDGRVGSMLNVVGRDEVRAVQELAVEDSRLGIPLIFGYDVVHGHKTIFPIPLAEAASWDLDLIEQSARIAAIEAAAQGLNWTFAPMVDISRDPRWGRVMEGAGEDPYLGSRVAVARVNGFQGDDLSADDTIAATIKHLAGYGFSEGGRDYNTVDVGSVTLHNIILPPFKAAIDEANVRTAMNSFNTLNGVPATGDSYLQRDLLKGAWGFDGFIVSDWGSGREMIDHGFAASERDAAELAIEAGSDMDMESYVYRDHLADLVESGDVDIALVDDAVRRVLRVKHELGLFADPYRYVDDPAQEDILMAPAHRAIALEVAKDSIVLLKNEDSLLPLKQGEKIALIGALAADKDTPLGNWRAAGESDTAVSVVEGFEAAGVDFTYREGAAVQVGEAGFPQPVVVNTSDRSGFDAAVAAARKADKVVLVLGEDGLQSGEGRSRSDIGLPGVQQELLEAVHAANPATVLVVMSGRPLILDWADANIPAIVQAWHLGHESGHAIASVVTGAHNPGGKLPMSFPRSVGQIPVYYNYLNTGRPGPLENEVFWSHYNDLPNTPLYPFGHGLSYTGFAYSELEIVQNAGAVTVSVMVENTGEMAGEEVVQLYLRDPVASVARPVRELKGFEKVMLVPGEITQVTFELSGAELGFYDQHGNFTVEYGAFEVYVGGSSMADLGASFTRTGD
ncbi:beta-glucosidase BglX [Aquisalinus flavus]|uniref:Beta-D-glucoside glucohydrolase n=1 Tax=Aquisalinus flavus TaxID=1526572 RepID=A0A8J2Y534_9PROT|nr:beta-glucosidase BglX [Aquisalinus flavus]MBD0426484.1 beta-glucosidase BglX [Aquisalinus flavus]UNE47962.1 beta-glucosidase BglX [Aquisalinus flavus]GGD07567.1 beta-glucosidase [Aquisalinus flavus]